MATPLDVEPVTSPGLRFRLRNHANEFNKIYGGVLGKMLPESHDHLTDRDAAAFKSVLYFLGFPDAAIAKWRQYVLERIDGEYAFIERCHHPTWNLGRTAGDQANRWRLRGVARRTSWRLAHLTPSNIGPKGVSFIKSYESFFPRPYDDGVGVWTIGYGHTGSDVFRLSPLTEPQASRLLLYDASPFTSAVKSKLGKTIRRQHELDGFVSIAFNIGIGGFSSSTFARLWLAGRRGEDFKTAFRAWSQPAQVHVGLLRRRDAELGIILDGVYRNN